MPNAPHEPSPAAASLTLAAVQTGPAGDDLDANLDAAVSLARAGGTGADLVVFPELFSRPFWCVGEHDPELFDWAETVDGPTLGAASALARELGATVVAPFFERGAVEGEYYNSAAVVGPDGRLVKGELPDGTPVATYRKNAISSFRWGEAVNDEKYYFRPGPGFAVFDTPKARVGVLICLDRWFPEAWRVLALRGADVVCVVNASQGAVSDLFEASMRTCAAQNIVSAVAVNRVGAERFRDTVTDYYGQSCVIDPYGKVAASAGGKVGVAVATLDRELSARARRERTMYRDRRPELYGPIVEESS